MEDLQMLTQWMRGDGYDEDSIAVLAGRMKAESDPGPYLEALERYFRLGTATPFAAAGITTAGLERTMDMTYPSALATILWLRQEPGEALDAIWYYSDGEMGAAYDGR